MFQPRIKCKQAWPAQQINRTGYGNWVYCLQFLQCSWRVWQKLKTRILGRIDVIISYTNLWTIVLYLLEDLQVLTGNMLSFTSASFTSVMLQLFRVTCELPAYTLIKHLDYWSDWFEQHEGMDNCFNLISTPLTIWNSNPEPSADLRQTPDYAPAIQTLTQAWIAVEGSTNEMAEVLLLRFDMFYARHIAACGIHLLVIGTYLTPQYHHANGLQSNTFRNASVLMIMYFSAELQRSDQTQPVVKITLKSILS